MASTAPLFSKQTDELEIIDKDWRQIFRRKFLGKDCKESSHKIIIDTE